MNKLTKINQLIKNNLSEILAIFILIQPIIDLITGLCLNVFSMNLTVGIIIRMLFLVFIMYITTFVYKKKHSFIYYLIFILYSFLYLMGIIFFKDGANIFGEVQGLLRTFYFPLLLISLYELKDEFRISKATLFTTLSIYIICIFIPITFNIGFQSYQITKVGTLGFYNSANEISGIISILTPIIFIMFTSKKHVLFKTLYTLIFLIVILTIGTKTPLLSLLITIGMTFIWLIIKTYKNKKYSRLALSFIAIVIGVTGLLIVIPKTNFYKNIKTHLEFLKVDNVVDVFDDGNLVDHFIFSQRVTFFTDRKEIYENSSVYEKLIGIGYFYNNKQSKLIEMDYFDIFYSHGVIGFIIFFGAYIYVLLKLAIPKKKLNFDLYMLNISIILILFLSLFTGHIITSPAVSIFTIILILSVSPRKKKNLLFTIYDLNIGGIETAIINLLNNINYKKYNVDLIMEKKEGILLSETNKHVEIKEHKVSNNKNILIRKIINFIRKLNFTILNYHNYDFSCCYATYSLSGNVLARLASTNTAIYVHNNYKYIYDTEEEIRKFFDNRKIAEFKRIVFVSNESKEGFLTYYKELEPKTLVINNFINTAKIKKLSTEKISEKKDPNKKLFVFIGRLQDHSKKVGRAINLVKEIDDIELLIVGDGEDKEMYEELVKKNKLTKRVRFVGRKKNPYPYIKLADYIILTSDYEGFPVTYLEAITLKKPIITTIDVSDDMINMGKEYASIISKDEKEMVKEVRKILAKPRKIKSIDIDKKQEERKKVLENIFDEVM